MGFTHEKWLSGNKFGKYTADSPEIDRLLIVFIAKDNFGRPVPTRNDILRELIVEFDILRQNRVHLVDASSQAKVTNLQVAVYVHQQIAGLDVSVHNVCGVQIKQASKQLVHEVTEVTVAQRLLRVDQTTKVCFHLFSHDVHVLIVSHVVWLLDVDQFDNVFVFKELQDLDLTQDALCIDDVRESCLNLFDCNLSFGLCIHC